MPGIIVSNLDKEFDPEIPSMEIREPKPSFFQRARSLKWKLGILCVCIAGALVPVLKSIQSTNKHTLYLMETLPKFSGKKNDLQFLKHKLIDKRQLLKTNIVSLCGESGVGKTELAIAFANTYKKDFSLAFWIDGNTQETVNQSYLNLGEVLGIKEPDLNRLQWKIHRELEKRKEWLLIFDDVKNFPKDLPHAGGGIIFTCRDKGICPEETLFEVKKSRRDALALLQNLTGESCSEDMERLVDELESLPLLVHFAGNYINKTPGFSVSKYHEIISTSKGTEKNRLIESHYPAQLKATYNVTLNLVEKKEPLAIDFLKSTAFLHSKNIPFKFLSLWLARKKPGLNLTDLKQGDILRELENHSLVRVHKNQSSLSIHHLLQQILIEENSTEKVEEDIEILLSDAAVNSFDAMRRETFEPFQFMIPHCLSLLNHSTGSRNALRLACIVARYFLLVERNLTQAENYLNLATSWIRDETHPINGRVLFLLGVMNQIKTSDAMHARDKTAYLQKALKYTEKARAVFMSCTDPEDYVGTEENPLHQNREYHCAICMQYQGQILRQLEQYKLAEEKLSEALLAFQNFTQNKDHYDIARTLREQAMLLAMKEEFVSALEKIHTAIDMQKRIYGKSFYSQRSVGISYKILGNILFEKGDYYQADQAFIKAIAINSIFYQDTSYPHSLSIYQKRADIYRALNLPSALADMEKKVQEIIDKKNENQ